MRPWAVELQSFAGELSSCSDVKRPVTARFDQSIKGDKNASRLEDYFRHCPTHSAAPSARRTRWKRSWVGLSSGGGVTFELCRPEMTTDLILSHRERRTRSARSETLQRFNPLNASANFIAALCPRMPLSRQPPRDALVRKKKTFSRPVSAPPAADFLFGGQ